MPLCRVVSSGKKKKISRSKMTSCGLVLKPSSLYFLMTALSLLISQSLAQNSPNNGVTVVGYPPSSSEKPQFTPFRPSMAVIVGLLTTMFSITFLLLLYAKHCKRGNNGGVETYPRNHSSAANAAPDARNSGIDRAVVESLPVFRFAALVAGGGQRIKQGLDCAVCLNRFEGAEILRLLPKCRHAFHVECVDTWLDAHSTCPLCRFRVDPEDVLLLDANAGAGAAASSDGVSGLTRVSGRHSSAGERASQAVDTASFRRSLDGWKWSRKKRDTPSRKDGLLLSQTRERGRNCRVEHRIVVSSPASECGPRDLQRWSDVQPSDLLYLRSEMILSDTRRFSSSAAALGFRYGKRQQNGNVTGTVFGIDDGSVRSVSEITGMSRFSNDNNRARNDNNQQAGLLSRWMAWVSQLRTAKNDSSYNYQQHSVSP